VLGSTSQGGVPLKSTRADDFSLLCPLEMDFEKCCIDLLEITRVNRALALEDFRYGNNAHIKKFV
jgi:hypothetical protein